MPIPVKCSDPLVLQEICDCLTDLHIPYLTNAAELEIKVKTDVLFLEKLLAEHGFDAQVLVQA